LKEGEKDEEKKYYQCGVLGDVCPDAFFWCVSCGKRDNHLDLGSA
jgi:hypothetical protein